ncbi:hypothetical protein [Candidatus Ruminimicrobium bovinum]|uniref:hypothetical protein n=1 Tax=Candidatus Ruminimicrobium bovinum TaxID=3242779 RepID=UPI0039B993FB
MNLIKNFAVCIAVVLVAVSFVYSAQNPAISRDASGAYVYETTIGSLVQRRMYEEIKMINNSSYPLAYITCKIVIKGVEHDMRPIPFLKVADSEGFDGYYEDDISREIPKYFGKDGKFSKKNNNVVKFIFKMRENEDKVAITDVYDSEDDLCFIISDTQDNYQPSVAPAAVAPVAPSAPAVAAPAAPATPSVAPATDDTTVVIDGKKYLIHGGKAYPVQ